MLQKCRRALGFTLSSVTFLCGISGDATALTPPPPAPPGHVQPKPKQVTRGCYRDEVHLATFPRSLIDGLLIFHSDGPSRCSVGHTFGSLHRKSGFNPTCSASRAAEAPPPPPPFTRQRPRRFHFLSGTALNNRCLSLSDWPGRGGVLGGGESANGDAVAAAV